LGASVVAGKARRLIWLEPKVPALQPFTGQLTQIREALGLPAAAGWAHPVTTPDHDLLIPVAGLDALRALTPNMAALAEVATHAGVRGVCLVSRETVEKGSATHCRFFAPHFGIPEDIVTGSVHSSIGVWLLEAGLLHAEGALAAFTAEQGDGMGRPGRLRVELQVHDGAVARVRVGGSAVTVLAGSIAVPDA
jgi:PhzF family phenazine biosynthesis protein